MDSAGIVVPGPRRGRWRRLSSASALAAALLLTSFALPRPLAADAQEDRRVESGLKFFRALLAADLNLKRKTVDDGKLLVVLFYTDDRRRAEALLKSFRESGAEPIGGLPVELELTLDPTFAAYGKRVPAGVYLVQPPDHRALASIVKFGVAEKVIVYSPFEGHVEKGILGGLAIEAQVRPYINLTTLAASGITLKELFLKVAKVYR